MENINLSSTFNSVFASYLSDFLSIQRALGFKYQTEEKLLLRFDRYCIEHHLEEPVVTKKFLEEWCTKTDHEKIGNVNKRIIIVRKFLMYTVSLGLSQYLPNTAGKSDIVVPHLFTEEEMTDFFEIVDSYIPKVGEYQQYAVRMANEYKILFRMYACCGLRNSEASRLLTKCFDLESGIITVLDAKGNKDRVVYVPDDLNRMCNQYHDALIQKLGFDSPYFFPGMDPLNGIPNTTVDAVFNRYWKMTKNAGHCNNKPTVHDFRFTFITKRLNLWAKQRMPVMQLLPYLSVYCGHKSMEETYYYYHIYKDLYDVIDQMDKTSPAVIPEVHSYEQTV